MGGLFITGTDTGVGKTIVTAIIAQAMRCRGLRVGVMKPIATGGRWENGRLVSTDAEYLLKALASEDDLELINPICMELSLAPLVAAELSGVELDLGRVWQAYEILGARYEFLILEGIGGLMVPIKKGYLVADLAKHFGLPLIIVARPGLGTINHTLLTIQGARDYDLPIKGFIFSDSTENERGLAELTNAHIIEEITQVPFLGHIPFLGEDLTDKPAEKSYAISLSWDKILPTHLIKA